MYITSKDELKDYTFRRLGQGVHRVEITDDQWNDIFFDALKEFRDYSDDGFTEKLYVIPSVNNELELTLPDNVLGVINFYWNDPGAGVSVTQTQFQATGMFHPVLDVISGTMGTLSGYVFARQYINNVVAMLKTYVYFRYNTESHKLTLGKSISGEIAIRVLEAEDETLLYDSKFLRLLVEQKCWMTWNSNTGGKYSNFSIGNGLVLNSEGMLDRAEKLEEKIEKMKEEDEFSMLGIYTTRIG